MQKRIKKSIICKEVENFNTNVVLVNSHIPKAGDVGLFEVVSIGKHTRQQGVNGRNHYIYPGDTIMATFGNRYATSQLEGYVPDMPCSEYDILGQGGVIGLVKSTHKKYERVGTTKVVLKGYVTDNRNRIINTKNYHQLDVYSGYKPANTNIILSIGGSMDSGKTTTAGYLCRGISKAGYKASFIKLTGTVYSKDKDFVYDCGADTTNDFADFGFPSTFMCGKSELLNLYQSLVLKASQAKPDVIVVEIADGLLQRETNMLLDCSEFMSTVDAVIYSDGNSTGVLSGIDRLKANQIVPFAICGRFTTAPLLINEVQEHSHIPILTLEKLGEAEIMQLIPMKVPVSV